MPDRPRELTDPRAMRALAHPTRLDLLEALVHAGRSLTATEAAERVGESPSSCSFHLRQLAKYGFVEEAAGGVGRRRPWRLTDIGLSFTVDDARGPEVRRAAAVLERALRDRYLARADAALADRADLPAEWQPLIGISQFVVHGTADELRAVQDQMLELLLRFQDRLVDPAKRPAGSRPVELLTITYPVDQPGGG